MKLKWLQIFLLSLIAFGLGSCIHEYPEEVGVDPSLVEGAIELSVSLNWNQRAEEAQFATRQTESFHRIITVVSRNGTVVGRDEISISDKEYSAGTITRKLPFKLHALEYDIAVWEEPVSSSMTADGIFNTTDLADIRLNSFCVPWDFDNICGYASARIDLRPYRGEWDTKVIKQLVLNHAGGCFELIATDVTAFLESCNEALLKGETYTLSIEFGSETADGIDAFSGFALRHNQSLAQVTIPLLLPFGNYDTLSIAKGFLFCSEEENVTMSLSVHNSARLPIVKTPPFRFSMKRGYITRVWGDFLSETFDNIFTVDNIWEGEIIIDL